MNNIHDSLQAIQQYNPKDNVYLRVIGEGSNQYLKAEKIGWFGRILMWFGCSSASFGKVARFMYINIENLCSAGVIDLRKHDNALAKLVQRVTKYDSAHPARIKHEAAIISAQFKFAVVEAQNNNISINQANASNPAFSNSTNSVVSYTPSLNVAATRKAPPTKTSAPMTPTQAVPMTPQAVSISPERIEECINEYEKVSDDISIVVSYLINKSWNKGVQEPTPAEFTLAAEGLKKVKELIQECSKDNKALTALFNAMTPKEIKNLLLFSLDLKNDYPASFDRSITDVFELDNETIFNPSEVFKAILASLSMVHLKQVIKFCSSARHKAVFYNLAKHISSIANDKEKVLMMTDLSNDPDFKAIASKAWISRKSTNSSEASLVKELAFYHLQGLLNDKMLADRDDKIIEFLKMVQWQASRGPVATSPLEDPNFMSVIEIPCTQELIKFFCQSAPEPQFVLESFFVSTGIANGQIKEDQVLKELAENPHFVKHNLQHYSKLNFTDPNDLILNKKLVFRHFLNLLENTQAKDREARINDLLEKTLWDSSGNLPNPNSPFEDQAFLDQLPNSLITEALTFFCQSASLHKADKFFNSLLFKKFYKNFDYANHMFKVFNDHHADPTLPNFFCRKLLDKVELADKGLIESLINQNDHDTLCNYIKSTLPHTRSFLENPLFIDPYLKNSIVMISAAIVNAINIGDWDKFYILNKKLFPYSDLTMNLFDECNTLFQSFQKFEIPEYLKDYSQDMHALKALVRRMVSQEREDWKKYQIKKLENSAAYQNANLAKKSTMMGLLVNSFSV